MVAQTGGHQAVLKPDITHSSGYLVKLLKKGIAMQQNVGILDGIEKMNKMNSWHAMASSLRSISDIAAIVTQMSENSTFKKVCTKASIYPLISFDL